MKGKGPDAMFDVRVDVSYIVELMIIYHQNFQFGE